jgi:hypothetical protein
LIAIRKGPAARKGANCLSKELLLLLEKRMKRRRTRR